MNWPCLIKRSAGAFLASLISPAFGESIVADSFSSGGASYSVEFAHRGAFEPHIGSSSYTIPDGPTITAFHGFVSQLEDPLFAMGDLALSISGPSTAQLVGSAFEYAIDILNNGSESAENCRVILKLPTQMSFTTQTGVASTFSSPEGIGLSVGALPPGRSVRVVVTVRAVAKGRAIVSAAAIGDIADTNPANNTTTIATDLLGENLWTGSAFDGVWHTPGNWQTDQAPGEFDVAIINKPDANVRINVPVVVGGLRFSAYALRGAGLLKLLYRGEFTSGFFYSNLEFAPTSVVVFSGSATKMVASGVRMENNGVFRWQDAGAIQFGGSAEIVNNGVFEAASDARMFIEGAPRCTFSNSGVFKKVGGTGETRFGGIDSATVTFNNSGRVEVHTGTLSISSGGTANGEFWTGPGAKVMFTERSIYTQSIYTFTDGVRFTGEGAWQGTGASLIMHGNINSAGFEVLAGELTGNFTLKGKLSWSNGWLGKDGGIARIASGSLLLISGSATKNFAGNARIENDGEIRWQDAGPIQFGGSAEIVNNGVFEARSDSRMFIEGAPQCTFSNAGVFKKLVGTGETRFGGIGSATVTFNNSGRVEVHTGTLSISSGGTANGEFWTAPGAKVIFPGRSIYTQSIYTFTDGVRFTGEGAWQGTGAELTMNGAIHSAGFELLAGELTGDFTLNGQLRWSNGSLGKGAGIARISPTSLLLIKGAETKMLASNARIENNGAIRWEDSGSIQFGGAVEILNNGLFEARSDARMFIEGAPAGVFNNVGVFRKTNGAGATTIGGPTSVPIAFNNRGILAIDSGSLVLSSLSSSVNATLETTLSSASATPFLVHGAASLDGHLIARISTGVTPAAGQEFQVLSANPRTGIFTAVAAEPAASGISFTAEYRPNAVLLRASAAASAPEFDVARLAYRDGTFRLGLNGSVGATYIIEASTDFANWDRIATNTFNNTTIWEFIDPTTLPYRFYRARTH